MSSTPSFVASPANSCSCLKTGPGKSLALRFLDSWKRVATWFEVIRLPIHERYSSEGPGSDTSVESESHTSETELLELSSCPGGGTLRGIMRSAILRGLEVA